MTTLFVNGRFLTQRVTGVQRYGLELMRALDGLMDAPARVPRIRLVCLAPPGDYSPPGWKNIELRKVGINRGNTWEQIDLALFLDGELLFSPANIGPWHYRNQIVMFHDASVFAVPEAYSRAFRAKYVFVFRRLSRTARAVITNSDFSRHELARYLQLPADRVKVVPLGADHIKRVAADSRILHEHNLLEKPYLLLVASLSPHKNIQRVAAALKLMRSQPTILVAGDAPNRLVFRSSGPHDLPANMRVLGYVSDAQLRALYEHAVGLIFPSTYEGFGLPILEAMQCGCPVLCADAASLPEVAGDAALFFDPLDARDLAEKLGTFLDSPGLRDDLRRRGHLHSARYAWSQTAAETLKIFLDVLGE
ncbi:MAG TPA: glycosyltransferase family 1 protein [Anaerolineales bacterium]|jgi:glycosyltransferase involved in cell wall biosynthesis